MKNQGNIGIASSEMSKMQREMAAAAPCEGCLNGYGCYNNEPCLSYYGSYPSQMYGQIPYSYSGPIPPYQYMAPQPGNQPYGYDFGPPPQPPFMDQQYQPPHPQAFHHAQFPSQAYGEQRGGLYYPTPYTKPPNRTRYRGPPRPKSKGNRSSGYPYNGPAAAAFPYEESRFCSTESGSDASSLTQTGNFSDDVSRAIAFVKRNSNATLFSIEGIIVEVATADHGTRRFIQERLKVGSQQEHCLVLKEAIASLQMLCADEKGSNMLQDMFQFGTNDVKKELLAALYEEGILELAWDVHGCRVIQKAITSIDRDDLAELVAQFHGQVLTLIHDCHGNHVIQRCIQTLSFFANAADSLGDMEGSSEVMDQLQFIINDVIENIESLSIHRYGCRVVQRSIEYCVEKQRSAVLEAIIACNNKIIEDQYGNYVVQQAILTGGDMHRDAILKTITKDEGSLFSLSKQKYASNVVEKMLEHGSVEQKEVLVKEMLKVHRKTGVCCAIIMAQDPIANFVVKKAIETVPEGEQKKKLLEELHRNREELLKSQYGKYIVNKELSVGTTAGNSVRQF